jgi:hypothetical protein
VIARDFANRPSSGVIMMNSKKLSTLVLVIVLATLSGCFSALRPRVMTAEEMARHGTRVYSADVTTGLKAATVALETLGFVITLSDPATGTIKTAPRHMVATSYGSTVYRDELAWVLVVSSHASGVQVLATPHAYTNGTEVPNERIAANFLEEKFDTLWKELDSDVRQLAASAR